MSNTEAIQTIISKMMESVVLSEDGSGMDVINEKALAEAEELLSQVVVERARNWWAQLESSEDALANMSDEISFSELNTDPSHVSSQELPIDMTPSVVDTVESLLDEDENDFNINSFFEMVEDDEFGPDDGDDQFDDMMRGDDAEGLGDDSYIDDGSDDDFSSDLDVIGDEDDMSDEFDDDMEFDFSFLDDEDDMSDEFDDDMSDDMSGEFDDDMSGEFDDEDDDVASSM